MYEVFRKKYLQMIKKKNKTDQSADVNIKLFPP